MNDYLITAFEFCGPSFPQTKQTKQTVASNFESWLGTCPHQSVVFLVDEYDAPLTAVLQDPNLFKLVRKELYEFYSVVKSRTSFFRFVFMTGITKFSETGIFSVLNDLTDISLRPTYAALLGYTQDELLSYFGKQINHAGEVLGLTVDELLLHLEENYDGYCFDGLAGAPRKPVRIYNPWSVLSFLKYPEIGFQNYWITSGGKPQLLTQYFSDHALQSPEEYSKEKLVSYSDLDGSSDIDAINDVALLTQAGYLTIREKINSDDLLVSYPNREVADSMAKLYTNLLLRKRSISEVGARSFVKALTAGNAALAMSEINKVFLAVNYERYPVRNEAAVQANLQIFVTGAGFNAIVEKHNACGRSDLEFDADGWHWVFGLKYLPESDASAATSAAERLCEEAAKQIFSRRYGEGCHGKLIRVAAVFNEAERQFTCWKLVEDPLSK